MEIPVSTRSMAMPMDTATPMDRPRRMADWEMEPMETSSTCLMSTWTAGSAATMYQPITIPRRMRLQGAGERARAEPRKCPAGIKPMFTPVRNMTRPAYVYTSPLMIRSSWVRLKRRVISWKSRNMAQMGTMAPATSRA